MKTIFARILERFAVSAVTLMILCSGSTLFVFGSFLDHEHECFCCNNDAKQSPDESLKCNKYCCIITDSKENKIVCSIPTTLKTYGHIPNQNPVYSVSENETDSRQLEINDRFNLLPQKIFLFTSSIRI